ncbi:MAG: EAL domain-containing protein [Hyphomicrobiaceae bacterium]
MALDNSKPASRRLGGKAGDAVVMTAMALVTLALCAGLILQAGLGFWLAGTVSLSFYMGLLTLHAIARRSGQIDELQHEVERLKAALGQSDGARGSMVQQSAPKPGSAPVAAPVERGVPQPPQSKPLDRGPSGMTPPPPVVTAAEGPRPPSPPSRPDPAQASATYPVIGTASTASSPPAPAKAAAVAKASDPSLTPAQPKVDAGAQPAAPALSAELMSRMQKVVRGNQPPPPPPPSPSPGPAMRQAVVTSSPPLRKPAEPVGVASPVHPEPKAAAAPPTQAEPPALPPQLAEPAIDDVPTDVRMPADRFGSRTSGLSAASPREADVEMIQGLIKKLAAEVNAAEAEKLVSPPPPPPPPSPRVEPGVITESVDALKLAANSMRAPVRASALEGEVEDAMRQHRAAKDVAKVPPPPSGPEPEFDVETLMRRAQSIAAMEVAPAPLPAAPNPAEVEQIAAAAGALPHVEDEPSDAPAARHVQEDQLDRIAAALDAGRVEVFLEPILDLARAQPSHYEVTVRLRDESGAEIDGGPAGDDGEAGIGLPLLDSIRLSRTAQVAQLLDDRRKPGSVFSTFHGPSLASEEFLSTFAETLDGQQGLPSQLVLTFAQSDVRRFRATHWNMIEEMRDLGFRFAMRAVTDLDMDFEALNAVGFHFVKLDADVFLEGLPAPGDVISPADLCKHLAAHGFSVVVEHLDDEAKRARVFGFGVLLGQGQLFGGPRLMKASALASGSQRAA